MTDDFLMRRCFQLAKNGRGTTYPNPLVGAVITHNGKIIGEGWHRKSGEPHAEIMAIHSVKNKTLLKDATLYVSLEPCSHFGKTPPCSHAIVQHQIPRVVIATKDYASHVNGQGINYLQSNNVEVRYGILEKEAQTLNRRFFTFHRKKRPYIILKWAQTQNGLMASETTEQKWITSQLSKQLVHKWRTEEQAFLIGNQTAIIDNPQLTARLWKGNQPLRLVIDKDLKTENTNLHLYNDGFPTWIINQKKDSEEKNVKFVQLYFDTNFLNILMNHLYQNQIQSLVVEGGATTLQYFIKQNLWDEARVFTAPVSWKKGISSPTFQGEMIAKKQIGEDKLTIYKSNLI